MVGLELITTLVTGGERGVVLKSNCPLRKACADNFIWDISDLSRFNVKIIDQEENLIQRW